MADAFAQVAPPGHRAALPLCTPSVVSPSRQFGLDLLAQALLGGLVGECCHFRGWLGAARCWGGHGAVLQDSGRPSRPGGVGRALVAAVDWVTGRRAGALELLPGEGEAPGCLGASVLPRPCRWSSAAANRVIPTPHPPVV